MTSEATRRRIEGDRPTPTPAPVPLSERTVGDLLTAAYALTHRMDRLSRVEAAERRLDPADLRAQRDAITAEVLRRTDTAAAEVQAARECGDHDRPLPCAECA